MLRNRNTKIIATLGPSSSSPIKIHSLFQAGADIFRLNFSHGTHEEGLIGQKASHGCIRMFNHDVIELYDLVSEDTLVNIL